MSKYLNILAISFLFICAENNASAANDDPERAKEVRKMIWENGDADFSVTTIPDKWKEKSAVIIAKSNILSYRKAIIRSHLQYKSFRHERIMLLDKAAIEKYSQFTIPENGRYGDKTYEFYAGFKIIKPDGTEILIPLSKAVKEERAINKSGYNQFKLAIPNLEAGDILDYYIGEEQGINLSTKYYGFDPVIFQLHDEYPIMKQKIAFDVLRRCFINLKSLNGAPDFTLTTDAKNDKNSYSLEDGERESVKHIRWLFPNRQLPSVKFKITYASLGAADAPTFIGEPGILKSKVTDEEIKDLVAYLYGAGIYYGADFFYYMKKHHKREKDLDKLARKAYYAYRNIYRIKNVEALQLYDKQTNESTSNTRGVIALSRFYKSKKIPHKILIGVSRDIATIDDLILENELMLMLKVNTKIPFYIGKFTNHAIIGEIDPRLEGTAVYAVDGHAKKTKRWVLKETTIPTHFAEENQTFSTYQIKLVDMEADDVEIQMIKSCIGANKAYYQNNLMDIYNFKEEEKARFEMGDDFEDHRRSERKELVQKKEDYLANRTDYLNKSLKSVTENDLGLTVVKVEDLEILQTGRFDDKPEFEYSCKAQVTGAVKKVGGNYLISIGKFIDRQIQLTAEEKEPRKYDINHSFARSYGYKIEMAIPEGYRVEGLDNLYNNIENKTGGFTSTAKVKGSKLIIESKKYYKSNFHKKEDWPLMVEFLDAAYNFTQQQVLLRKI